MTSYIPSSPKETEDMLRELGATDLRGLMGLPEDVLQKRPAGLPAGLTEMELLPHMKALGAKNRRYDVVLRGAGAYRHFIPAVVDAAASANEFVTAYTPYQAELSQGLLCAIFEYQTQMCALTGLPVCNASLYDGGYALAEAVMMCRDSKKRKVLLSSTVNPRYAAILETYCKPAGFTFAEIPGRDGRVDTEALKGLVDSDTACVVVQSPNCLGLVEDTAAIGAVVKAGGAQYILSQNPLSLALYATPAEAGADICTGDAQPFGMPLSFGGPYLGYLCCTERHMRNIGGRIVGQTADRNGNRAFVLTLQAREQHIRREHAKSSICSNQALCALRASVYLSAMGPAGLTETAMLCRENAAYLRQALNATGVFKSRFTGEHFHEFATTCPDNYTSVEFILRKNGILGGLKIDCEGEKLLVWCATELVTKEVTDQVMRVIREAL
jgi:glycine dehydrogenase subunit 1